MSTYNLKYQYNNQPTINTTETDLDVDSPYAMLYTLLNNLSVNQRKNLRNIYITSGVSDKHKNGYKKEINIGSTNSFYKVTLSVNKTNAIKGDSISCTVTVTNVPTVSKVEFYLNSIKLGEDTTAPYSYSYLTDTVGNYLLTAKVIDSDNVVTVSNTVMLTIN